MTTITIQVPGKAKNRLSSFVKELGGEIISISTDRQLAKKAKLLKDKAGFKRSKRYRRGESEILYDVRSFRWRIKSPQCLNSTEVDHSKKCSMVF